MHTNNFNQSWSRSLNLTLISISVCMYLSNITYLYMYFIYKRNNITKINQFHESLKVK